MGLVRDQLAQRVARVLAAPAIVPEAQAMPFLVGHVLRPVGDHRLDHGNRCRIQRAIHAADLADDRFHLGNGADRHILLLDHIQSLADRGVRHGGRHVEERALVERWHEFLAESWKRVFRRHPRRRRAQEAGVEADPLDAAGKESERALETQPGERTHDDQDGRYHQELGLVVETPAQNGLVEVLEELDEEQNATEQQHHEEEIQEYTFTEAERHPVRCEHPTHHADEDPVGAVGHAIPDSVRKPRLCDSHDSDQDQSDTQPPAEQESRRDAAKDEGPVADADRPQSAVTPGAWRAGRKQEVGDRWQHRQGDDHR
jgi:hypothetical protein